MGHVKQLVYTFNELDLDKTVKTNLNLSSAQIDRTADKAAGKEAPELVSDDNIVSFLCCANGISI